MRLGLSFTCRQSASACWRTLTNTQIPCYRRTTTVPLSIPVEAPVTGTALRQRGVGPASKPVKCERVQTRS